MTTTQRSTCWSLTINNPVEADEEDINLARQKGWTVEGQKEQGENGTIHYQLMLKTPQTRFSTVKKAFPRAHIEIARNVAALQLYVNKEETRVGSLRAESDCYPSLSKLWQLMYKWLQENRECYTERIFHSLCKLTQDQWLEEFDRCICDLIDNGYHVESLAVNPSVRSSVKKYGFNLMLRTHREQAKTPPESPQTVRQTDTETTYTEEADITV